jgi:Cu-Zn family superoxide dismutase
MRAGWMMLAAVTMGAALACGPLAAQGPKEIKVPLMNSKGEDSGYVTFKTVKKGVKMHVVLKNVSFGDHGVHIHEHAVCDAPDFKGAGGHFNPDGKHHGYDNPMGHHTGDTPKNVSVGEDHMGEATFVLNSISMDPSAPNSIFSNGGTAVVVHEKADDEKSDPAGNAGNRIACGVVKVQ